MEEPADTLTRWELAQKYQVHSTRAVDSWDFKSLIWVELCPFPARLGMGVEGPSPYLLTWGSQSLPLHPLKSFKKKNPGEGKALSRMLRRHGHGQRRNG